MALSAVVKAHTEYQAAAGKAEALRVKRKTEIIAALEAGSTASEIARALGMTRARIAQIVQQPT